MEESLFYDPISGWFFSSVDHGDKIPSSAIEISRDQHVVLAEGVQNGKVIVVGEDGALALEDRPVTAPEVVLPTTARRLLATSDVVVLRAYERSEPVPSAWVKYRDQLRAVVRGEPGAISAGIPPVPDYPS